MLDDRYELLEVIASGGMSSVWRAHDRRLDRLVAVKRPHPTPAGSESWMRMSREARVAAAIKHPNLVTVFDYGSDDEGPYLVMELVEGPTLQDVAGEVTPAYAIELGAKVADGLAAIHGAGIVHRDVKPANVILSDHGPLLTDFGIALDTTHSTQITSPGQVVATPHYAAPEVMAGGEPTAASDVYSLAVVIDQLIRESGQVPDRHLHDVLQSALADAAEERPTAEGFADQLRRAAPTAGWDVPGGSTLVLERTPQRHVTSSTGPEDRDPTRWLWPAAALVLLVGVAAIAAPLVASDPEGEDAGLTVPESATTLLTTPPTTVVPPVSSTMGAVATSAPTEIAETRDRLEGVLNQTPRSDLNPPDVEDVMKKVDDAIESAEEDDLDKSEEKLSEVAKKLDEKLEGRQYEEAIVTLQRLATLIGVEVDRGDSDDDD